ncbi:uncharacterized protein SOCE26_066050 [Sorangium cellulosum]|uniref:Glycosyltransferase RgtA/B/C/D-like domain-containing protein n=1 Tax=Sorangium cellulosum TaxID=56 RepID=A0A2L0F0P0_SORCE|nr:hypothetical protein [Sorangium cellulosum]AUX45124.1 uncharacterized protein SOCE26_066050 [Sorangium cellulosum]
MTALPDAFPKPPARLSRADLAYGATVFALTLLSALPFWLTDLLPMMDYPPFLTFVRAFQDYRDPSSPFHGTYTLGWPLSPLLLPLLVMRLLAAVTSIELAGKLLLTLYAIALPAASIHLLRVLRRDRWCVLLVFPLVHSYWVSGGFFAFATAPPLVVLGLAFAVRWLDRPSPRLGAALAAVATALFLWHALAFAQLLLDFTLLWALWRAPGRRARWTALLPAAPSLALFALWMATMVLASPSGGRAPGPVAAWPPFLENAGQLLEFVGVLLPISTAYVILFALLVLAGAAATPARPHEAPDSPSPTARYHVPNPFAVLALANVACYLLLPSYCLGVEGINNRHPWMAALLFTFAWSLPARPAVKAGLLASTAIGSGLLLLHLCERFMAFHEETVGASRLIDRLSRGQTLLAPLDAWGATTTFPVKPLRSLQEIATVRHGGLPNHSFAGYGINIVQYVGGRNPMPGLGQNWLSHPELARFDYVLLRSPSAALLAHERLELVARDGRWALFAVRR